MEDKLKKSSLSIDEMSQLEALDIKGGKAGSFALETIQNQCPNNASGCACSIEAKPAR